MSNSRLISAGWCLPMVVLVKTERTSSYGHLNKKSRSKHWGRMPIKLSTASNLLMMVVHSQSSGKTKWASLNLIQSNSWNGKYEQQRSNNTSWRLHMYRSWPGCLEDGSLLCATRSITTQSAYLRLEYSFITFKLDWNASGGPGASMPAMEKYLWVSEVIGWP